MNINKNVSKKTFLITGANGYLGSSTINYLSRFDCKIFAIYNLSKDKILKKKSIKLIKYDLRKKIDTSKIPKKVDFIIHFASNPNDRYSVTNRKELLQENTLIDTNVFQLCSKIKYQKFIYASSSSVYDDNKLKIKNESLESKINVPYEPDGLYGLGKLLSEKFLESSKINFIICRIFSIYGNDSNTVINLWNNKIKNNKNIEIWKSDKINRSWLHIDDFVRAMIMICLSKSKIKYFNIASDENLTLKEIINLFLSFHKNSNSKYTVKKNVDAGPKNRFGTRNNLNKIGFNQNIYLKDGIRLLNSKKI